MKFEYKYKKDKRGHQHTTCILRDKKGKIVGVGKVIRYHKDSFDREYGRSLAYVRAYEDYLKRLQKREVKKDVPQIGKVVSQFFLASKTNFMTRDFSFTNNMDENINVTIRRV